MNSQEIFLVTGGNGFVGSWVVKGIVDQGFQCLVLDRDMPGEFFKSLLSDTSKVEWITGSIEDAELVRSAVAKVSKVIHTAGVLTPTCSDNPVLGFDVNLKGSFNILQAVHEYGINGFAYTSSAGIYSSDALVESPETLYGAYKLSFDIIAESFYSEFGLKSTGLRPLVIYGPGREIGSSAGVSLACKAVALNKKYKIDFAGTIDAIFVEDVANALIYSVMHPDQSRGVHTLSGELADVADIANDLNILAGDELITVGESSLNIFSQIGSNDLLSKIPELSKTDRKDGFIKTIEFYKQTSGHKKA